MKAVYIARDPGGQTQLVRRPIIDAMSKTVVAVSARALLGDALVRMTETGLRHLAVVDDEGRCVGVLSDRAIAAAWAVDYGSLSRRRVSSALDPELAMLDANRTVVDAARLMHRAAVDAVVVVDAARRPVGIVTGSDLVSLLAR